MWLCRLLALLLLPIAAFGAEAPMPRKEPSVIEAFDGIRADYEAARSSRFRRARSGLGGTADAHLISEAKYWELREYARDAVRNDMILGQAVDRAVQNIHRTGFDLECQTGDDALDDEIWAAFWGWANDRRVCDVRGLHTLRRLGDLVLSGGFVDGDIFALPLMDGQLQLVEGDCCVTPSGTSRKVRYGIFLDEVDRPKEYWFAKPNYDRRNIAKVGQVTRYPAYDEDGEPAVLHFFRPSRYTATRGVPVFAPVFNTLSMLDDLNLAKLVQAQVVSCIAAFIEGSGVSATGPQTNVSEGQVDGGLSTRIEEKLRPGLMLKRPKGEKITGFSPGVPNPEYFEHAYMLLRIIGANLGLPITLLMLDTHDTVFHGYRGELQQARMGFERIQRDLIELFYAPVYRWKVRQFVESGRLSSPSVRAKLENGTLFAHRWQPPAWPYVDPMTDAQADALVIDRGLASPRGVAAGRGLDYDDVVAETVADNAMLIQKAAETAKKLSEDLGVEITWRDVLSPRPEFMKRSMSLSEQTAPGQGTKPPKPAQQGGQA